MTDLRWFRIGKIRHAGAAALEPLPWSEMSKGGYARILCDAELDKNSRLGVIAIQDESAALASVSDMRRQTIWISLVAGMLTLVIGFFFAKKLTQPVQELAVGAHRIASGDFSQRINVRSRTELGDLGNSFNLMTDQLENYIRDLQRSADENRELFLGTVKGLAAAIDGKEHTHVAFRASIENVGCDRSAHGTSRR